MFVTQFILKPRKVGAIWPSSQGLARRMTEWVDLKNAKTIAEFGPGTGVFTQQILDEKNPDADFFAVELNESLAKHVSARFPDLDCYNRSIGDIDEILEERGITGLDAIICGLPWTSFPHQLQIDLLEKTYGALNPGGRFVTFSYHVSLLMPTSWRFRKMLDAKFEHVARSRPVFLNMPSAFVYECQKAGEPAS
jgi:phospholipid N-methyltransferase